jgi:hypothetical protein
MFRTVRVLSFLAFGLLAACAHADNHAAVVPPTAQASPPSTASHKRFVRGTVGMLPGWRAYPNSSVLDSPNYDYAPSIMLDGMYRMWWCNTTNDANGNGTGDQIAYAESTSLSGPWHGHLNPGAQYDITVCNYGDAANCNKPSSATAFDGEEACDPSVLRVGTTYYMYYGGLGGSSATTRVGLATSTDGGYTWTRANGGNPIVLPATDGAVSGRYGAGQPSAIYVKPYFYLMYFDDTGTGGPGEYVLRSPDPTFQTQLQRLSGGAFVGTTFHDPANTSAPLLGNIASADWTFNDSNQTFVVANTQNSTTEVLSSLIFNNDQIQGQVAGSPMSLSYSSIVEGPGILTRPDRHIVPSTTCGQFSLTLVVPVGTAQGSPGAFLDWRLEQVGTIISTGQTCSQIPLGDVFEGSLLTSANAPLALVIGGSRLQFALAAPANRLAHNTFTVSNEIFFDIPYAASMYQANTVYGATGRPGAFLFDDNKLWAVSCYAEVADDQSQITMVSTATWDSHARGPDIICLSNN